MVVVALCGAFGCFGCCGCRGCRLVCFFFLALVCGPLPFLRCKTSGIVVEHDKASDASLGERDVVVDDRRKGSNVCGSKH